MSEYLEYRGEPMIGSRRSSLLFMFASVAYAVVAKDIFPTIYETSSDIAARVSTNPASGQTLYSAALMLEFQPYINRAALAVLLLLTWGFYFWTIIGIRSTTRGSYSVRQLVFDMAYAVCLYCAASSLQAGVGDGDGVSPVTWSAILALSVMFHIRFLYGLYWCLLPGVHGLSVESKVVRKWINESLPAAHTNCLAAAVAVFGITSEIGRSDAQVSFDSLSWACFAYCILAGGTIATIQARERAAQGTAAHSFWQSVAARSTLSMVIAVLLVVLLEAWLWKWPQWVHDQMLRWRTVVPVAAVLLGYIVVQVFVRWVLKRTRVYLRARKGSVEEILPAFYEQAVEEYGTNDILVGVAQLAPDGSHTDLVVCAEDERAKSLGTEIVQSVGASPDALEALRSNVLVCRGAASLVARALPAPHDLGIQNVPFVLASAKRHAPEVGNWVAFVAHIRVGETDIFDASDDPRGLVLALAETVAQLVRRRSARASSGEIPGSPEGTLRLNATTA